MMYTDLTKTESMLWLHALICLFVGLVPSCNRHLCKPKTQSLTQLKIPALIFSDQIGNLRDASFPSIAAVGLLH